MVCRLIDLAIVFVQLLIFKVCGITGISKIGFLNFSGNRKIKQNQKNSKAVEKT